MPTCSSEFRIMTLPNYLRSSKTAITDKVSAHPYHLFPRIYSCILAQNSSPSWPSYSCTSQLWWQSHSSSLASTHSPTSKRVPQTSSFSEAFYPLLRITLLLRIYSVCWEIAHHYNLGTLFLITTSLPDSYSDMESTITGISLGTLFGLWWILSSLKRWKNSIPMRLSGFYSWSKR